MATADLWDLTGATQARQQQYISPNLPAGTKKEGSSVGERTAGTTSSSSSAVSAINTQNTPGFALEALQALITQLSDRPAISSQDALNQLPDPISTIKSGGPLGYTQYTQWIDPLTGMSLSETEAIELKRKRQQERTELQRSGGVIAGGTEETRRASGERQTEIQRNRSQQAAYSKDAAFADAANLQARFSRTLMEQLMPQITRAAEASGTSGGAVRGLLVQDAASRVAEAQSALGLDTAAKYGALSNQLAGVLELLTRENNPVSQLLMQALGIAKGTVQQGTESKSATTVETKTAAGEKATAGETVQTGGAAAAPGGVQLPTLLAPTQYQGNDTQPFLQITKKAVAPLENDTIMNLMNGSVNARLENFSY
jgi:hypothetical protein